MSENGKDHCSLFPEHWFGTYIGDCCSIHDKKCSTHRFYKCLRNKIGIVGASVIALGGALGCWIKYTSKMTKRV